MWFPLSPFHTCEPFISSVQSDFCKEKTDEVYKSFSSDCHLFLHPVFFFIYILQLESLTTQVPEPFFPFKNGPFVSLHPFFISSVFNGKKNRALLRSKKTDVNGSGCKWMIIYFSIEMHWCSFSIRQRMDEKQTKGSACVIGALSSVSAKMTFLLEGMPKIWLVS